MSPECNQITIDAGDHISVDEDPSGEVGVLIHNPAFGETRWLSISLNGYDGKHVLDDLIDALDKLRDALDLPEPPEARVIYRSPWGRS